MQQQQHPETVAVDVSGKSKKLSSDSRGSGNSNNTKKDSLAQAVRKFQPREALSEDEDDSDTDVVSSEDEGQESRNSYSSLERFLVAYDLEEYYPM